MKRTRLELIRTAAEALLKQGVQSRVVSDDPDECYCRYRGPNGTKCGVGHLIPDEKYRPDLENRPAGAPEVAEAVGVGCNTPEHQVLREIQSIHDCYPPEFWAEKFAALEARHS